MTISDSLPVQFWDIDDDTFNETDVCGLVKQDCFCQPIQCDDEITLQFQSTSALNIHAVDKNLQVIENIQMIETSTGVWAKTFIFSELASPFTCDQKIQLLIREAFYVNHPSNWQNNVVIPILGTLQNFVSKTSTQFTYGAGAAAKVAAKLRVNIPVGATINVPITMPIALTGVIIEVHVFLCFINSAGAIVSQSNNISIIGTNSDPGVFNTFTPFTGHADYMVLVLDFSSGSPASYATTITVNPSWLVYENPTPVAKSDCLDVKLSQSCTKLIGYSNSSDFDGLIYGIESPDPTFYLRVPAMFFEEKNPQEQEDLELSNGRIITIRQTIQEKRLLELGFMPNYMHRKVQKVLMHETISIDGTQWKKRDSYDDQPVRKYNLKRASVLLTKYDSVEKNTI